MTRARKFFACCKAGYMSGMMTAAITYMKALITPLSFRIRMDITESGFSDKKDLWEWILIGSWSSTVLGACREPSVAQTRNDDKSGLHWDCSSVSVSLILAPPNPQALNRCPGNHDGPARRHETNANMLISVVWETCKLGGCQTPNLKRSPNQV